VLELKNIKKVYPAGGEDVQALKGIDLRFRESEFVCILGPSGCGKTTMLNIIGGLDQYTEGDLIINGRSTKEFRDRDWDAYRNHSIGFVFQSYNLIPHQSVLQNVELALTLSGVSKRERRQRAAAALERVGLGDQLKKKPAEMSGGQMQRVAIARAIVNDPDIVLADEPTGALDTETSLQVMDILKEIAKDRLVIMVTHNPDLAARYATRTVRMLDGLITDDSRPLTEEEIAAFAARDAEKSRAAGKRRMPSMSFATSFGLSLKNLYSKRGRTTLTSFAGSIGIIGIALIIAVSQGVSNYIDQVQEDTLSSYPITIEAETLDMTGMVTSLMGVNAEREQEDRHELDAVYSNTIMYDLLESLAGTETRTNNLKPFKAYLEREDNGLAPYVSAVQYSYDLNMSIYARDIDGKIFKSDVTDLLQTCMSAMYGGDYSSYFDQFGSAYSRMEVWEEMLPPQEGETGPVNGLLRDQYDLIYGSWPAAYDEVVLIVDENNEISDLVIYCMGLGSQDNVIDAMEKMMNGETLDDFRKSWRYEELCGMTFKIILPAEYYQYDSATGSYTDVSATETGLDFLYSADDVGTRVKVVGILRPNEDAVSAMMQGAIGYTSALTDHLIEKAQSTEILRRQKEDPATDVISGLPFLTEDYTVTDEKKASDITAYLAEQSVGDKAAAYIAMMSVPDETYLDTVTAQQMTGLTRADIEAQVTEQYARQMGVDAETVMGYIGQMDDATLFAFVEEAVREQVRQQYAAGVQQQLGAMSNEQLAAALDGAMSGSPYAEPLTAAQYVWLYDNYMPPAVSEGTYEGNLKLLGDVDLASPKTVNIYAATFAAKDAINKAIDAYNDGADEDDQIQYTDYMALLMRSVTSIINAITYVLIAFVAISLVVSSIMIGVITLISVQERTKEIGILRAIGASKRNVSSMFNAETVIIGSASGLLGVLITYLLCIPINVILHNATGINTLSAYLPPLAAAALVVISMLLTLFAGIIPSRSAARKDPVVALRTE